jgi:hypothetical protein
MRALACSVSTVGAATLAYLLGGNAGELAVK